MTPPVPPDYSQQEWRDNNPGYPLAALRMRHIEAGVAADEAFAKAIEEYAEDLAAEKLAKAENLKDLPSASTARTSLGLGTAATEPSSAFDPAGAATTAEGKAIAAAASVSAAYAVGKLVTVMQPSGDTTGKTDGPAINAASKALEEAGGGQLVLGVIGSEFFWTNEPILARSKVDIIGVNESVTIKLAAASNCHLATVPNFETLRHTGANNVAAGEESGSQHFRWANFTLDGNREAQTISETEEPAGGCVAIYGQDYELDIKIHNAFGTAYYTEFGNGSSGGTTPQRYEDSARHRVRISGAGRHGWHNCGPTDGVVLPGTKISTNNQGNHACAINLWADKDGFSNGSGTSLWSGSALQTGSIHFYNLNESPGQNPDGSLHAKGCASWNIVADTQIYAMGCESEGANVGQCLMRVGGEYFGGPMFYVNGSTYMPGIGLQLGDLGVTPGLEAANIPTATHTTTLLAEALNGASTVEVTSTTGISEGTLIQVGTQVVGVTKVTGKICSLYLPISGAKAAGTTVTTGNPVSNAPNVSPCSVVSFATNIKADFRAYGFLGDNTLRSALNWVACNSSQVTGLAVTGGEPLGTAAAGSVGVDVTTWLGAGELKLTYAAKPHFAPTFGTATVQVETPSKEIKTAEFSYYGMGGLYETTETLRDCLLITVGLPSGTVIISGAEVKLPTGVGGSKLVATESFAFHKGLTSTSSCAVLAGPREGKYETLPKAASQVYGGVFGDGSDGAAVLTVGGAAPAWATKTSESVFTMTRDCFCSQLAVEAGVTLVTHGYVIWGGASVSGAGTVTASGNAGTNTGVAGTKQEGTTVSNAGGKGNTGAGEAGVAQANGMTFTVGIAGKGGKGTSAGGAAGVVKSASATYAKRAASVAAGIMTGNLANSGTGPLLLSGAAGGGGGGGDGTKLGGGGGAGGGIVLIFAQSITGITVTSKGGEGGEAEGGNAGGGGGGGGGVLLTYALTAPTITAPNANFAGGKGGKAAGTGEEGEAGKEGHWITTLLV
jgi:hypothetical protein